MHSGDDPAKKPKEPKRGGSGTPPHDGRNVGDALRAVYRETIDENVPDAMLDLLKKLD